MSRHLNAHYVGRITTCHGVRVGGIAQSVIRVNRGILRYDVQSKSKERIRDGD